MDEITLDGVRIDGIVGVLDFEQREAQPIELGVTLGLDLGPSGDADDLGATVDYAVVRDVVVFLATEGRFRLIETMALSMLRAILAVPAAPEERALVAHATVTIRKPTILGGPVPGLRMTRDQAWARRTTAASSAGGVRVEVLHEVARHASWRIVLDPGATWRAPAEAAGLVIAGAVVGGPWLAADGPRAWTAGPTGAVVVAVSRPG